MSWSLGPLVGSLLNNENASATLAPQKAIIISSEYRLIYFLSTTKMQREGGGEDLKIRYALSSSMAKKMNE